MCSLLALLVLPALSHCVTLRYKPLEVISKSKVELSPMLISCGLSDIVVIAAPVVDIKSLYYLHKPNNDVIKLEIPRPSSTKQDNNEVSENDNMVKYINEDVKPIFPIIKVIHPSHNHTSVDDDVKKAESRIKGNEFMIGPLLQEDHGNWVLSVYFKDVDDNWIELFQVITIEIVEHVPLFPTMPRLKEGDTFRLGFAYPIEDLQSCELTAPSSTYDRFFDRTRIDLERCGYIVNNVTKEDAGIWRIIGVGKIMFEGQVNLLVV